MPWASCSAEYGALEMGCACTVAADRASIWRASPEMVGALKNSAVGASPSIAARTLAMTMPTCDVMHRILGPPQLQTS